MDRGDKQKSLAFEVEVRYQSRYAIAGRVIESPSSAVLWEGQTR